MTQTYKPPPITSIIVFLVTGAVTTALVYGIWWSLAQTVDFTSTMMRQPEIGLALGIIIQFWAQVALYGKNKVPHKSTWWYIFVITFWLSTVLDIATNIGEWASTEPFNSKTQRRWALATLADMCGFAVCIAASFFEEAVSWSMATCLSAINDVLAHYDHQIRLFQWAEQAAKAATPIKPKPQYSSGASRREAGDSNFEFPPRSMGQGKRMA